MTKCRGALGRTPAAPGYRRDVGNFGGGEVLVLMILVLIGVITFAVAVLVLLARRPPVQVVVVQQPGEPPAEG